MRGLMTCLLILAASLSGCGTSSNVVDNADTGAPMDLARIDLAALDQARPVVDQATPFDAVVSPDFTTPADLTTPSDLTTPADLPTAADPRCAAAGAAPAMATCCLAANDYPNQCLIGACSCSPMNSHQVKTCLCPMAKCFDGLKCK